MDSKKKALIIPLLGIGVYIIFIGIAMITYSGGTMDNSDYAGYHFWGNTFSDLGRLVSHNGQDNLISMILFSIAYLAIALTFIPLYYLFPQFFVETSSAKKGARIGSLFGFITSFCFIGVVFTPADILRPPHMIFAFGAYAFTFFTMAAYSFALFSSNQFPKQFTSVFMALSALFFIILMIDIIGLSISRNIMVVGQKFGRLVIFTAFSLLISNILKIE